VFGVGCRGVRGGYRVVTGCCKALEDVCDRV